MSIFEDLGIQQAPHRTLNSYLEKLVVLLTGNFGEPGGMNLHTRSPRWRRADPASAAVTAASR